MTGIKLNFQVNEETQSISELWESVMNLAKGRVEDNNICDFYPLGIRERQLFSLKVLVKTIENTHKAMQLTKE